MHPLMEFRRQSPEFWALVKLASQILGYSVRKTPTRPSRVRRYLTDEIVLHLRERDLDPDRITDRIERVAVYSNARADLLENTVQPNLMNREEAARLFEEVRGRVDPPEHLLSMNKQTGDKRHYAYLAGIVNMLTHEELTARFGRAQFNPRAAP